MTFNNTNIDSFLHSAQVAIDNSLNNPAILQAVGELGYTSQRLQQGKKLYNLAAAAQLSQQSETGDQRSASQIVKDAWDAAKKPYIRNVKIARIAFKRNSGIATQLDLSGKRKQSLSGWLAQANQFYKNALEDKTVQDGLKGCCKRSCNEVP